MREILFKAKRLDNGEWVEGYYSKSPDPMFAFLKDFIFAPYFDEKTECGYDNGYMIDINTLCQYTGLTDKNGNKIWENDLVKRYYADGEEMVISQIVFSEGSLNLGWCKKDLKSLCMYKDSLFETGIKQRGAKECDVIGNIFDNPELLGV